jgi:hypothetical protein
MSTTEIPERSLETYAKGAALTLTANTAAKEIKKSLCRRMSDQSIRGGELFLDYLKACIEKIVSFH